MKIARVFFFRAEKVARKKSERRASGRVGVPPAVRSILRRTLRTSACERTSLDARVYSAGCGIQQAGSPRYPRHAVLLPMRSRSLTVIFVLLLCAIFSTAAEPPADVVKLAAQLASTDRDARREAGHSLEKLGPGAKPALPALIMALDDSDKQVWANAFAAIAAIGPEAADAIPRLLDALDMRKSNDYRERDKAQKRMRAAHALACIGDAARPALIAALKDDDTGLRLGAAKALGEMGGRSRDAIPALIENLGHSDEELRSEVIETLGLIGAEAVAPLTKSLSWPDPRLRSGSARALAAIGTAAATAGPEILTQLQSEKESAVRAALFTALPRVGLPQEQIVPPLVKAFRNGDEEIQSVALNALLTIRPAEKLVVPALAALLMDSQAGISERAALALGRFGSAARLALPRLVVFAEQHEKYRIALTEIGRPAVSEVLKRVENVPAASLNREHWTIQLLAGIGAAGLPELERALASPAASVRVAALGTLNELGEQSREVRPAVLQLTGDSDPFVRATALSAVVSMATDTGGTLKKIEAAMRDPAPVVRLSAAMAAEALGATARGLAASLTPLLDDKEPAVRAAALRAAGALGGSDEALTRRLAASLDDPLARGAALSSLAKTGADAAAAAKLIELYPNSPKPDRLAILNALGASGPGAAAESVKLIVSAVQDGDAEIRAKALAASVKVHASVKESLPALIEALHDPQISVRRTAAELIGQIGDRETDKVVPALSPLVAMLASSEDRTFALEALRSSHVRDIPAIEQALVLKSAEARAWACERAAKLGSKGRPLIEKLKPLLADGNDYVRRAATKAIDQLSR